MDTEFLKTDLQSDLRQGLRSVLTLFQDLNLVPQGQQIPALQNLQQLVGDQNPTIQNEIENFVFVVPAQTFTELITELGTTHPKLGTHYTERNGVLHRNSHPASYNSVDPDLAGWTARDNMLANAPADNLPTNAQLTAEYDRARAHQEGVNRTVARTAPIWTLLQRDSTNDVRQEDSMLVFLDLQHKQVDWYTVVKNLKRFGEPIGYNEDHYKRALDRFVGFFAPSLKPVTDELPALELAQFLMRMSLPAPKFEKLATQIQSLVRNPGENLRSVLAQLHGLASAYFADRVAVDQPAMVNRLMIQGLMSFTMGQTHTALTAALDSAQIQGKTPDWRTFTESVINSERVNGTPQVTLQFKQVQPTTATLFHSTNYSVQSPVQIARDPIEYSLYPGDPFYAPTQGAGTNMQNPVYQPSLTHYNPRPVARPVAGQHAPVPVQQAPMVQPAAAQAPLQPIVPPVPPPPTVDRQVTKREPPQGPPRKDRNRSGTPQNAPRRTSTRPKVQSRQYDAQHGAYMFASTTEGSSNRENSYSSATTRNRSQSSGPYDRPSGYQNDRQSRTPDRKYSGRQQSYSPYRGRQENGRGSPSPSRIYRSNYTVDNRGRTPTRYPSSDKTYNQSNSQRTDRYPDRDRSRGRNNYNDSRNRTPTRYQDSNKSSQSYRQTTDRYPNRDRSNTRSPIRYNNYDNKGRNQDKYNDRNYTQDKSRSSSSAKDTFHSITRPRSQSASRFPGYLPGVNCSSDYQPWLTKHCMKCFTRNEHHECYCPRYYKFHEKVCYKCNKGFHHAADCQQGDRSNSKSPNRGYQNKSDRLN